MEQGSRLDSTLVSARQDTHHNTNEDPALDAAITAALTRPDAGFVRGPGGIDPVLDAAVEAHRSEVQRQLQVGAISDEELDANMDRLVALGDVIRNLPPRSLADLRHKVIYLWPDRLSRVVLDAEWRRTFDSFRSDLMRLADPSVTVTAQLCQPNGPADDMPTGTDPIFAAIATAEALEAKASALLAICASKPDDDPGCVKTPKMVLFSGLTGGGHGTVCCRR